MKPNSQRARNAIVSLYSMIGISVVMVAFTIYSIYVQKTLSLIFATDSELASYLALVRMVNLVHIVLYITCWVVFILWFRRAYFNLHKLVPSSQLRYSEGWAAGAWFIPIFYFWGPYQIASDLFSKSESLLVTNNLMDRQPKYHQTKNLWWGFWVAAIVLERIGARMERVYEVALEGSVVSLIALFLFIAAGILAIKVIKNYSEMEELLTQIPDLEGGSTMQITNDDLLDSGI